MTAVITYRLLLPDLFPGILVNWDGLLHSLWKDLIKRPLEEVGKAT